MKIHLTEAKKVQIGQGVLIFLAILNLSVCSHFGLNTANILHEQEIQSEPEIEDFDEIGFPYVKMGKFSLSFYCPCEICVGKKKEVKTATGTVPKAKHTIAVDPKVIPLGSIVYIENYGYFIAEDTGGNIKGNRIDIFVNNHEEAIKLGRKKANVYILTGEY